MDQDISISTPKVTTLVLVRNIPVDFHSSELRAFFSLFVELEAFSCFHFRHRPEKIEETGQEHPPSATISNKSQKPIPRTLCCFSKVYSDFLSDFFAKYNGKNWTNSKNTVLSTRCHLIRVRMPGTSQGPKIKSSKADFPTEERSSQYLTRNEQKVEQRYHQTHRNLQESDLLSMIEMTPPPLMPQGNVGTPTRHFLDLIQKCQMPSGLIKQLGLTFPKGRKNRKYGQVQFQYGFGEAKCSSWFDSEFGAVSGAIDDDTSSQVPVEDGDDLDNDECEEWERHEALNDDVTTHERNKERLFEDEEEVVWEKGGPGIVWNMDANFWKEQAGGDDLDEATDDWDVDMSGYYEESARDKDARDFLQIRREKELRAGKNISVFQNMEGKVGEFEKFTKGIGRRLMERSGWEDTQGIGKMRQGIPHPVSGEGQMPYSKRGLGFYGKEIVRHPGKRLGPEFAGISQQALLEPGNSGIRITTCYDAQDPGDSLKRRARPGNMKYRPIGK